MKFNITKQLEPLDIRIQDLQKLILQKEKLMNQDTMKKELKRILIEK